MTGKGAALLRPCKEIDENRRGAARTKLGNYETVALLRAGGMGEVYRARDLSLQREVAVKILSASYSQDADRLRRFAASQICTWSKG